MGTALHDVDCTVGMVEAARTAAAMLGGTGDRWDDVVFVQWGEPTGGGLHWLTLSGQGWAVTMRAERPTPDCPTVASPAAGVVYDLYDGDRAGWKRGEA